MTIAEIIIAAYIGHYSCCEWINNIGAWNVVGKLNEQSIRIQDIKDYAN